MQKFSVKLQVTLGIELLKTINKAERKTKIISTPQIAGT